MTEDRRKAALLFIAAVALLATMDMIVKFASSSLSTPQIVWGRYVSQTIVMVFIIGPTGMLICVRSKVPLLHTTRALVLFAANFAFMAALRYLPLVQANMVGFVSPLLLTALTYPVLGERVGFGRWAAVIAGFIGVLVVLQPGTSMFQWAATLPLMMAICAAIYHVMTPIVARVEDPAISIYFLGVIGAVYDEPDGALVLDATRRARLGHAVRNRRARYRRPCAHRPRFRPCACVNAGAVLLHPLNLGDDLRLVDFR